MKRLAAVFGLVAASSFAVAAPASSAPSTPAAPMWSDGVCPSADGVTVVIDFQELGGGVHVRCAPGPAKSGFDALQKAGIDYQTTVRFPGFLCKIAGKPSNDPCIDASPARAYWSYWLAPRGGIWCYSNWGAGNRTPPPGSVEGWSFSLDKTSSSTPPPGFPVPAPIPGAATSLPGNDCDPNPESPKAPTTTSAPVTAPPTTRAPVTAAPTVPGGSTGSGSTGSGSTGSGASGSTAIPGAPATNDSSKAGASAGSTGTKTIGTAPSTIVPDSDSPDAAVAAETAVVDEAGEPGAEATTLEVERGESTTTTAPDNADVAAGEVVNLSGDGSGSGSPVAVVVTGSLVAAGALVALVVRKRASSS